MKTAFLSDVHGNLEALTAVLDDFASTGASQLYSLGDIVGYGPEPEATTRLIREHAAGSLMGNHELALFSRKYHCSLNPVARASIDLTRKLLSPQSLNYLEKLPASAVWQGLHCVHGSPPDSITEYLFSPKREKIKHLFQEISSRHCLFGHTHTLHFYSMGPGEAFTTESLQRGSLTLKNTLRYLINIGSVGQPRDGDRRAKYVLWDQEEETLEVRYVDYDVEKTVAGIIDRGFPISNANRLR